MEAKPASTAQIGTLTEQMGFDSNTLLRMKAFVGFTDQDNQALRALLPVVTDNASRIVDIFYSHVEHQPELLEIIRKAGSNIDRLKDVQRRYLIEMFEGNYGPAYVEQRLKIGLVHNRIGLTPRWYLGAYSVYITTLTPLILRKYRFNGAAREAALAAMNKIISIDAELAMETYLKKSVDAEFADYRGQIEAIGRALGVIEFNLDGTVRTANDHFLHTMGYRLEDIRGKHHRMFVEPELANSPAYDTFWNKLAQGEYDTGEYKRITKQGGVVWLQASYNPIRDVDGQVFKVVKYATDVTAQKRLALEYQNRVTHYSQLVEKVAQGDLRPRVTLSGESELNLLGSSLNTMTENLAGMARDIGDASNAMATTMAQLQGAVNAQSAGAAEQAAAVSETTATLEEIKATSAQTLAKSLQLGESAERTRQEGEQGLHTVELAIQGMEAIRDRVENIAHTILALSEQTQQIGEITSVVTNLAQQSKMLALNASIEAAKAGDAGRGFAVVAAEVKALAEQSQQSTAQVQRILQDIRHATDKAVMATEDGSKGVDAGVVLVQRTGNVMIKLSEIIRETSLASQQIVAAVRQEATGIDQVTAAMSEINKVTSQFVASTQQTQQASAGLNDVAQKLRNTVSVYKI